MSEQTILLQVNREIYSAFKYAVNKKYNGSVKFLKERDQYLKTIIDEALLKYADEVVMNRAKGGTND